MKHNDKETKYPKRSDLDLLLLISGDLLFFVAGSHRASQRGRHRQRESYNVPSDVRECLRQGLLRLVCPGGAVRRPSFLHGQEGDRRRLSEMVDLGALDKHDCTSRGSSGTTKVRIFSIRRRTAYPSAMFRLQARRDTIFLEVKPCTQDVCLGTHRAPPLQALPGGDFSFPGFFVFGLFGPSQP